MVVLALSQWDKRSEMEPERETPTFVAAVNVSPGYDISTVLRPERFKWPYNPLLTQLVKDHFLGLNEAILRAFNNAAYEDAMAADSLQGLVDASAPFAGLPGWRPKLRTTTTSIPSTSCTASRPPHTS